MADGGDRSLDAGSHAPTTGPSVGRRVGVAVGLTVLAVFVSGLLTAPVLFGGLALGTGTLALVVVVAEVGYGLTALAFVALTDRGVRSLRPGVAPDVRTALTYAAGGAVVLFALRSVVLLGATTVGVPLTPPRLTDVDIDARAFALAMIPLSLFVVAPCEEAFFRGVLQQYLDEAVSTRSAVLGAGALFAVVHAPQYLAFSAVGAAVLLAIVFVAGLGFGSLYARTESLPVAVGAHGLYNALIMGSALVLAEFGFVQL